MAGELEAQAQCGRQRRFLILDLMARHHSQARHKAFATSRQHHFLLGIGRHDLGGKRRSNDAIERINRCPGDKTCGNKLGARTALKIHQANRQPGRLVHQGASQAPQWRVGHVRILRLALRQKARASTRCDQPTGGIHFGLLASLHQRAGNGTALDLMGEQLGGARQRIVTSEPVKVHNATHRTVRGFDMAEQSRHRVCIARIDVGMRAIHRRVAHRADHRDIAATGDDAAGKIARGRGGKHAVIHQHDPGGFCRYCACNIGNIANIDKSGLRPGACDHHIRRCRSVRHQRQGGAGLEA